MRVDLEEQPGAEWDAFAAGAPGARLGHAAAWADVLLAAYGLRPHYLACRGDDGALLGVLPLCEIRTLRGRRELVSLPFHDSAGLLAACAPARGALLDAALAVTRERRGAALELRQAELLPELPGPGPSQGPTGEDPARRVDLILELQGDEEAQWSAIGAKVRNQVRKAHKEGLALAAWSPPALLDGFYDCFAVNMRDLDSPVHAKAFYREAARRFGDRLRFIVAADGARAVGGLVAIHTGDRVAVTWASTLRSERRRCPNNLIYWEALRWAVDLGARYFDFGRSPVGGGTHRFKRGWGAEERLLAWVRLGPDGAPLPPAAPGDSPVLTRLSSLWSRMPLWWTRRLGPRLRRHVSS